MGIAFPEELRVGVPEIDRYHEALYDQVNRLRQAMRAGDHGEATGLVAFLADYAREHFEAEERLMRSAGYPELDRHSASHDAFRKDLAGMARRYSASGPTPRTLVEVSSWLADWLADHIRGEDVPMARWVQKARRIEPGAPGHQ